MLPQKIESQKKFSDKKNFSHKKMLVSKNI